MNFQNLQRAAVLAFATAGFAAAQNDECTGAVQLTVNAATPFDTTAATLSAEAWTCAFNVGNDIWFRYVPAANSTATVSTCGSGFDTVLQVFSGSCGALTLITCLDDFCGLQTEVVFGGSVGTTYYIRLGGYNGASGTGTILLTEAGPPPPAAPPVSIVSNLPGTWVEIAGTGTPLNLADDGEINIVTTLGNIAFPAGVARVGSNGGVRFRGMGTDLGFTNGALPNTAVFNGDQALLPFWDDMNTVGGTVGNIYWQETQGRLVIQWDDAGFFNAPGEIATYQIQVFSTGSIYAQFLYQDIGGTRADNGGSATIGYQAGNAIDDVQWSFNSPGAVMDGSVLSIVPAGPVGVGTNYCTANVNSTGVIGVISGSGSASVAANNLTLNATSLPLNAFGYFITSATQAVTPNPGGSQGILCIGGQIGRYTGPGQIQNTGSTGSFSLLINLTQIPTPTGFVAAAAGQVRNFQAWHRDSVGGVATSNFTNGLEVTFTN